MGKNKKQAVTTSVDPGSQSYIHGTRNIGANAANVALAGPGGAVPPMGGMGMGAPGVPQLPPPPGPGAPEIVRNAYAKLVENHQRQYGGTSPAGNFGMGGGLQPQGAAGDSWFIGPDGLPSIGDQAAMFMNPYQSQVIDATRGEFGHLRDLASRDARSQATLQGAYGGDRAALMEGARLGELDRAEASQIGGMMHSGYQNALGMGLQYNEHLRQLQERQLQEPLWRQQMALGFRNQALGPVGQQTTQTGGGGSLLGNAAGGAMTGAAFGPWGAAIGGGLGLLGGLFG